MSNPARTIRFSRADLELFAAASHDRNPLHLSEIYAHKTVYGECVVFGILQAVAAIGQLSDHPSLTLSSVSLEFRHPLFADIDYRVETDEAEVDRCRASIYDGERLMARATVRFRAGSGQTPDRMGNEAVGRSEPVERTIEDMTVGLSAAGAYAPSPAHFEQLIDRLGLRDKAVRRGELAALLWSSYIVGMELPGRRALFWSLDMTFDGEGPCQSALTYRATVENVDTRFEFVTIGADLSCGGTPFAHARIRSFVRRDSPASSPQALAALLPASRRLAGKVALVIGGSRGLGAALVQGLALQGCAVLATYLKSTEEAERVREGVADAPGSVEVLRGNAADEAWCRDALTRKVERYGGLDILICNAAPPIRSLGLSLEEMGRFLSFNSESLAMVAVPMAAFLPMLSERSGWNVLISSSFVRSLPVEWPHYVAAKFATEGLAHWAAAAHPGVPVLVVRPPRLLTDQTNTPAGRQGAMPVEQAAATIVKRLCQPAHSGGVEMLEEL